MASCFHINLTLILLKFKLKMSANLAIYITMTLIEFITLACSCKDLIVYWSQLKRCLPTLAF